MMTAPLPPVKSSPPFPARLRGVLFDMDGVLVSSSPAWFRILNRAAEEFGAAPVSHDVFVSTFGQGVEADRDRFFPDRSVEEILAFYDRTFPEELALVEPAPGAASLLAALRQQRLARAVVTNAPRTTAASILAATGLDALLDLFVASGDAAEKPAPDLLHLALGRLGLAPADVVYVGDTPTDREAAAAAGAYFVGFGIEGERRISALDDLALLLSL